MTTTTNFTGFETFTVIDEWIRRISFLVRIDKPNFRCRSHFVSFHGL